MLVSEDRVAISDDVVRVRVSDSEHHAFLLSDPEEMSKFAAALTDPSFLIEDESSGHEEGQQGNESITNEDGADPASSTSGTPAQSRDPSPEPISPRYEVRGEKDKREKKREKDRLKDVKDKERKPRFSLGSVSRFFGESSPRNKDKSEKEDESGSLSHRETKAEKGAVASIIGKRYVLFISLQVSSFKIPLVVASCVVQ